jgi:hypothetical protein
MKIPFASSNLNFIDEETVKSAFEEFSISLPVSALSDAIIFSPSVNVPFTFTRFIVAAALPASLVSVLNRNPVALDVAPFN